MNVRSHHRGGGVCSHAASVRPFIPIIAGFVVLGGGKCQGMGSVCHDDEAGFLAYQKFLDHDTVSCFTEGVTSQHVFNGSQCLGLGLRNHHAFASSQAIGFDDDGSGHRGNVGRCVSHISETRISRCRNAMAGEKIFTECFGTFQLGGCLTRAKTF